jgi:hypothetical protein
MVVLCFTVIDLEWLKMILNNIDFRIGTIRSLKMINSEKMTS